MCKKSAEEERDCGGMVYTHTHAAQIDASSRLTSPTSISPKSLAAAAALYIKTHKNHTHHLLKPQKLSHAIDRRRLSFFCATQITNYNVS